ncbi:MAG TPA: hypothetical protein VLA88_03785 [Candidatus Saccharimonadales bacterium]|nr:hypothetical protein [Candidatus Saccharimonadales bacterium]
MLIATFFAWWYGVGWMTLVQKVSGRVTGVLSFFSVGQLLTSLFAPFRQISAGRVQGPLGVIMRAWVDRLFSRGIGAIVRSLLILTGLCCAAFYGVLGVVMIVFWPVLPVLPLLGLVLMISGYKII